MEATFQIVFMSPEALFAGRKWRELLKEEPYHSNFVGFVSVESDAVRSEHIVYQSFVKWNLQVTSFRM